MRILAYCRDVERNALRANLVERAEDWRWCSLWRRRSRDPDTGNILSDWPIDPPRNWLRIVNQSQNEPELAALRRAVQRSSPFGSPNWTTRAAARLSLQRTLRPLGRPKKTTTS